MASRLVITSVENLQKRVNESIKLLADRIGIYISLNKTHESIEKILRKNKISTKKIFFIDCVSSNRQKEDVLYIHPNNLGELLYAIKEFFEEIKEKKFLIIDSLSTLLIYNDENKVASFVRSLTEYAEEKKVEVIAISPITKGEELLNKIFNFFDEVKKEGNAKTKNKNEELIY